MNSGRWAPVTGSSVRGCGDVSAYLAVVVKHGRAAKGLTQEQAGEAIHYSGSLIGMIETGKRIPTPDVAARLDDLLGMDGLIIKLVEEARRDRAPAWFRPWAEIEREATSLRSYQASVLPGLLQTEAYARAVLSSGPLAGPDVDQFVAARLDRQAVTLERDRPPLAVFVMDEAALRRGKSETMHEQLNHLVKMSERSHVMVHVVPLSAGAHPGQAGPFVIAGFDEGDDVAYLDDQLQGRVVSESSQVAQLKRTWDAIRSVALPRDQSADLIREVAQT